MEGRLKRVLFICGGVSGEHEVSMISCKHVLRSLDRDKFSAVLLYIDKEGRMMVADESKLDAISDNPKEVKSLSGEYVSFRPYALGNQGPGFLHKDQLIEFDVVFSIIHGEGGEDGAIHGLFKTARIPMVGCNLKVSAICMDKALTKKLCQLAELPVVAFKEFKSGKAPSKSPFDFPVFVKPVDEGSSIGVSKATNQAEYDSAITEASRWSERIMVEPSIEGRELEVAVFDDGTDRVVSPVGEIVCAEAEFYSYDAKYVNPEQVQLMAPAKLEESSSEALRELASDIFDCLDCRGIARIDFLQDRDGKFFLNEVNTMPGFTPISMYPKLLALGGLDYSQLITRLILSASL